MTKEKQQKIINFQFPFWQAFYILILFFICIASYGINGWFQLKEVSKTVDQLSLSVIKTNESIVSMNGTLAEVRQRAYDNTEVLKRLQDARIHN